MQLVEVGAGILPCVVVLIYGEPRDSTGVIAGTAKGILSETAESAAHVSSKGEVDSVRDLMAP
jgi:hypothetical protein